MFDSWLPGFLLKIELRVLSRKPGSQDFDVRSSTLSV
jgi:hypothetical protein